MKNKNLKFWQWALLGVMLFSSSFAQSPIVEDTSSFDRVLSIKTHVVRPVLLSFFKSDAENQINGEVFFPSIGATDRMTLEGFDSQGAKFYSQEFELDLEKAKSQKFRFKAPSFGISAGSRLVATLYSQEDQVGRAERNLPRLEIATRYRVSNLKVLTDDQLVSVGLDFENGSPDPIEVRPQIKVWHESVTPSRLLDRAFFETKLVGSKSRAKLGYSFELPEQSGVYKVELVALDDKKQVLSGVLEGYFEVPGDYADFDGSFVTANEKDLEIKFTGDYEGRDDRLNLEVAVNLYDHKKKLIDRLTQDLTTPVNRGSFEQILKLNGNPKGIGRIESVVVLKNQAGEWLSELAHEEKFEKPTSVNVEEGQLQVSVSSKTGFVTWKWYHWAGLVLAVVLLLALLIFVWKRHKPTKHFIILLLLGVSSWSTTHASLEVFWHHPVPGWFFNQNAVGVFEEFGVMKLQGNIFNTLTQKGFFEEVPERIVVSFFKDLDYDEDGARICTDCFYLEADLSAAVADATCLSEDDYIGPEVEICDNKTYRFELDLPDIIEEGQWGIQVLFRVDGNFFGTEWIDVDTGEWFRIHFDSTPPSVSEDLTYDDAPPPLGGDLVVEAKPPLLEGAEGLTALSQSIADSVTQLELAKSQRSQLNAIADQKLKARNHKIAVDIFEREQAILSNVPNASDLQIEIEAIVNDINALTQNPSFSPASPGPSSNWPNLGINDIAQILGEFVPPNLAVNPTSVLSQSYSILPLAIQPLASDQVDDPINAQITGFESDIISIQSQVGLVKDQLRSIKQIHKSEAINVGLTCSDPVLADGVPGAGCNDSVLVAAVRGNFCEFPSACEESSVRTYQVCDRVGNCTDAENIAARLDWYDPVAPDAIDFNVIKNKDNVGGTEVIITGDGDDHVFAAGEAIAIEVDGVDPEADRTTHPTLFDADACGSGAGSDFFRNDVTDDFCTQSQIRCPISSSKRGFQDLSASAACVGDCPDGFALQGDLCVPFCDFRLFNGCFPFLLIGDQCEITAWLPDPTTVPFGDPFTQVNNCGQTRQAVGTRSITGTLNHFLDGKEVFGAYLYDTTEDTLPQNIVLEPNLDAGGTGGFTPFTSIQDFADMTTTLVNSPSAGTAFQVRTFDVAGPERYGAWRRESIPVSANRNYVLSYWVKTDATVNKNEEGAWIAITGNGPVADIFNQYSSTMEGVPGDLQWYKVIIPFTVPAGTSSISVDLRVQQQNNKQALFDDIKIFEENWRFDENLSWFGEVLDDETDGICDFVSTQGGQTVDGPDNRCGERRFPERAVLVYTTDGFYIFDAERGSFWSKSVVDPNSSVFGRFVFNALQSGQTFGLNGQLYLAHRFNEPSSTFDDRNGAVEVMDMINDRMFTHRMSGCFLLAGAKGIGTNQGSINFSSCENNGLYDWTGFVDDKISDRNVTRNPWDNEMPPGRQIASHQINHMSAAVHNGTTYVAVATEYGISVLNQTGLTVQHLEWDGTNGDNFDFDFLPANGNSYHQAHIEDDGSLWYKWNFRRNSDDGSRIWKYNDVSNLPFNNGIISGNSTADSRIQTVNQANSAYPTTSQNEDSTPLDIQGDQILSGGDIGVEKFKGVLVDGDAQQHPGLSKTTINRNFATAPLYGKVLGHWVNNTTDRGDYGNNLTVQGVVPTHRVASGADLRRFEFDGTSSYLSSGSSDFNVGPITFGTWVQTTGNEDGGYIMSKGNDKVLDFSIYRNPDNTLRVSGTTVTEIPGHKLGETANGWDFVAVTFDGTSKKTYLNQQLISAVPDTKVRFDGSSSLVRGRYVRIIKDNNRQLSLAEVEVFNADNTVNLALSGTATQIDTAFDGIANRAIDGNTDGNFPGGSVTHTDSRNGEIWWELDLGVEQDLGEIVVWNRTDCCRGRLSGAVVQVLDEDRNVVSASGALSNGIRQPLNLISSGLPDTRYVRVEKSNTSSQPHLYLAEVQVFDAAQNNLSLGGTATQISTCNCSGGPAVASRAIDNNTDGDFLNFSVTRTNSSPVRTLWWEVDLGVERPIDKVAIWNRTDSRSNYLSGATVQLLDNSRNVLASSQPLSSVTSQNPTFISGAASSFLIGTAPTDSTNSTNLLSGSVALPFVSEGAYTDAQLTDIYQHTLSWFNPEVKITLQGTSNQVLDLVFGDDDDYFVVTDSGISHFDKNGVLIRTLTTSPSSSTNTSIVSNNINDIDYKNRYLIIAYRDPDGPGGQRPRGLEIITIGTEPND